MLGYQEAAADVYSLFAGPSIWRLIGGIFLIIVSSALAATCYLSSVFGRFESVAIFLAGFLLCYGWGKFAAEMRKYARYL